MKVSLFTSNFNKKLFIVIRICLFICILVYVLNCIGNNFENISNKNQSSTYVKQALNTFYNEKKNIDLLFIGSSHSYCTFDPEYFDLHTNFYSYQLGTPLQHPDTSLYMLKEVLNYKKPNIVILEVYFDMLDDNFELKQADMFLNAVKNDKLKKEYINNVFPYNEKIKYYFKPIRYQQDAFSYYNKKIVDFVNCYKIDNNKIVQDYVEYYRDRGFLYTEKIMEEDEYFKTNQFVDMDGKDYKIDKKQKKYLVELSQLCNKNNIELYFVTAPISNVSLDFITNYDVIHKSISELSESLGVEYIDYNNINKEYNLLSNDNFYDDAHLNYSGAVIVQNHFINWLTNLRGRD